MSNLLEEYVHNLQAQIERECGAIADGRPATLEEYRQRVGYVKGLKWALSELEATYKKTPKEER